MKTLPNEFVKKGQSFRLIRREGNWSLWEKIIPASSSGDPDWRGWEVMKIKVAPKDIMIKGITTLEAGDEYLPSDNQWGKEGWSYSSLAAAEERMSRQLIWDSETMKKKEIANAD